MLFVSCLHIQVEVSRWGRLDSSAPWEEFAANAGSEEVTRQVVSSMSIFVSVVKLDCRGSSNNAKMRSFTAAALLLDMYLMPGTSTALYELTFHQCFYPMQVAAFDPISYLFVDWSALVSHHAKCGV